MERRNRVLIAGTGSGAGKTTISVGLMGALRQRGMTVQGFKCGPDYIDPTYHTMVTGRPSRNLDAWMLPRDTLTEVFLRSSGEADISVIEGVMGLFDGKDPLTDEGSSAEIAVLTKTPVLLVVDVSGTARSAAATVKGFQLFKPELHIAGVVANRCGSNRHFQLVHAAVKQECGIPVICWLQEDPELKAPERHLGLVPADEFGMSGKWIQAAAAAVEMGMDWEELLRIASGAPPLVFPSRRIFTAAGSLAEEERPVIAYAKDQAFLFYYPENLELLELKGANLVPFSPLSGERVPLEADGLYMGGGYPEEFADRLALHSDSMNELANRIQNGLPVYAECGGYMYLARSLTGRKGISHGLVGAVPGHTTMQKRLAGFGYREAVRHALLSPGEMVRGHEFHYSDMQLEDHKPLDEVSSAYTIRQQDGTLVHEGFRNKGLTAGYAHFHFASNPMLAERFVEQCRRFRKMRRRT